jgi:hypothetical protein
VVCDIGLGNGKHFATGVSRHPLAGNSVAGYNQARSLPRPQPDATAETGRWWRRATAAFLVREWAILAPAGQMTTSHMTLVLDEAVLPAPAVRCSSERMLTDA